MNDLNVVWWPVDRPRDYPKNARKWSAQAIEKVGTSLRAYGFRQPVVVDRDEVICIGHLRRAAARSIGMSPIRAYGLVHGHRKSLAEVVMWIPHGPVVVHRSVRFPIHVAHQAQTV